MTIIYCVMSSFLETVIVSALIDCVDGCITDAGPDAVRCTDGPISLQCRGS